MNMNFKTRNEARKHCWANSIPLKRIQKLSGSRPWVVSSEEIAFRVGRKYKLIDVDNFIKNRSGVGVNKTNMIQADQILKHLPEGVEVVSVDLGDDKVRIKSVPGLAFHTLRTWEAQFFVDVTEANTAPAPAPKPAAPVAEEEKPKPEVQASADLDSELDGGEALAQNISAPGEKDPTKFIEGREYVLVDREGFKKRSVSNLTIIEEIERVNGKKKPFVIDRYTDGNGFSSKNTFYIRGCVKTIDGVSIILFQDSERQYFREADSVTNLVHTGEGIRIVNRAEEERKQKYKEALDALQKAQEEHSTAIDNVRVTAAAVFRAADALSRI